MKLKLLCLIGAAIFSLDASALEIHKGYLISQKEWSTGGNASFRVFTRSLPESHPLSASAQNYNYSYASTEIGIITGKVGIPLTFSSHHKVNFYNTTTNYRDLYYVYIDCFNETDCSWFGNTIQLDAKGYFHDEREVEHTITFKAPGIYTILSKTWITDEYHNDDIEVMSKLSGLLIIS